MAKGKIEIEDGLIEKVKRGLLAVNISAQICKHSFIAYVDKNLKVRDYFTADFEITLPEQKEEYTTGEKLKSVIDILDLDLLKMNFTPPMITFLLKSIFLGKKIIIISEQDFLKNHILNFMKYIFQDTFSFNVTVLSIEDYMKEKGKYSDHIILGRNEVLRDNEKNINLRELKIEKKIVGKFFDESNLQSSLIILKNEISKLFDNAREIYEFLASFNGEESNRNLNYKVIMDHLKKKRQIKISQPELNLLLEIIEKYFNIKIPETSGIKEFLGFI